MDRRTIETYSMAASGFADEWRQQPPPEDMYEWLRRFFVRGGGTADIGCGAGRDVAWLNANGFPAVGYDASSGLLGQARVRFPQFAFGESALPKLEGIDAAAFDNVLCETVIMHLPPAQVGDACRRLRDILKPRGVLYLTWRVSPGESFRDAAGRLYSAFDAELVMGALRGMEILLHAEAINQSSGRRVQRVVARRAESEASS